MMRLVKSAMEEAQINDEYDPSDKNTNLFDSETKMFVEKECTIKVYYRL